jgi:hypothetical protein
VTINIKTIVLWMTFAALATVGSAQEVALLDLTGVTPRTDLRYPPSPPAKCDKSGVCTAGGVGGMSIACGGVAPGELRTSLSFLDRSQYVDGDKAEIEATVQNVGKISLLIPWTPHLGDLQPADENAKFVVYELQVGLFLNWGERYSTSLGWLHLYGDPKQPGTTLTLKPGERVRIRGQIQISLAHADGMSLPAADLADRASASTLFKEVEYIPHPGGLFERVSNTSPKQVTGTSQRVQVSEAEKHN